MRNNSRNGDGDEYTFFCGVFAVATVYGVLFPKTVSVEQIDPFESCTITRLCVCWIDSTKSLAMHHINIPILHGVIRPRNPFVAKHAFRDG